MMLVVTFKHAGCEFVMVYIRENFVCNGAGQYWAWAWTGPTSVSSEVGAEDESHSVLRPKASGA